MLLDGGERIQRIGAESEVSSPPRPDDPSSRGRNLNGNELERVREVPFELQGRSAHPFQAPTTAHLPYAAPALSCSGSRRVLPGVLFASVEQPAGAVEINLIEVIT